jgi:hypothetical protein
MGFASLYAMPAEGMRHLNLSHAVLDGDARCADC